MHFTTIYLNLSGALQIGGGVNEDNALDWIEAGAEKVRYNHVNPFV